MASDNVETAALLKACSLFRGFTDPGLLVISRITVGKKIPAGTPIFVQNMVADAMYIIQVGVVELSLRSSQGKEAPLGRLTTGESFGELSLLVGGHRMVTATAVTDCELLEISRRQFANLQKQKPQACLKLILNIVRGFGERLNACRNQLIGVLVSGIRSA